MVRASTPSSNAKTRQNKRGSSPPPTLSTLLDSRRARFIAIGASLLLQWIIFPPVDYWPLAYVCFVPWILVLGADNNAHRAYVLSYVLGLAFFAITMRWLYLVTIPGAIILFAAMALYYPLVACPIRHVMRRRRIPLAVVFPAVWTGCEALRSMVAPRFPWCLVGHSQHSVLSMIQICDVTGAYGVSFVVAAVNGFVVDLVLVRLGRPCAVTPPRPIYLRTSAAFTACVLATCLAYGGYRLATSNPTDGPRIAIIQGNYPNYVDEERARNSPTMTQRADRYFELVARAARDKPDLFLLPETPWIMYLNRGFIEQPLTRWYADTYTPQECYNAFTRIAREYHAYVVTGSTSLELTPLDVRASERRYNSAFVFPPDGGPPQRYDKMHLVFIGEYVPFRYGPLRFFYLWINRIMPFGGPDYEYSLTPGHTPRIFALKARSQNNRLYRFATPICYENVMPYLSRAFVAADGAKRCDFLLNLSNDGWFAHSSEQPQHLAASVFRAVENRVGVARAVNTGISCFIDPDGRVHDTVSRNGVVVGPGVDGYRVARVKLDDRLTLYSRFGDVLAIICAGIWGVFYLDYILARIRESRKQAEHE